MVCACGVPVLAFEKIPTQCVNMHVIVFPSLFCFFVSLSLPPSLSLSPSLSLHVITVLYTRI